MDKFLLYLSQKTIFLRVQGSVFFLIILLFIPQLASKYIDYLNRLIHLIGYILKTILFSILFVFILCPVAIFKKKSNKMGYIHRNIILSKKSFEKMW